MTTREKQIKKLAPNNQFTRENAIELANEFFEFEGMVYNDEGDETETCEEVEQKAIKFLEQEGYKFIDVKCNNCDWKGNTDDLILKDSSKYETIEYCPNCDKDDYLMDL
jgi:hypothetical protein